MSHYDRDAEIAAFILTKGVTRCPTACVVPTQGSPDAADQAALERHEIVREQLRQEFMTGPILLTHERLETGLHKMLVKR